MQRQRTWQRVNKSVYIHLTMGGKIFIIKGETGEARWISAQELKEILREINKRGGEVLYSREHPEDEKPCILVKEIFEEIASYDLPIKFVEQHPRTKEI